MSLPFDSLAAGKSGLTSGAVSMLVPSFAVGISRTFTTFLPKACCVESNSLSYSFKSELFHRIELYLTSVVAALFSLYVDTCRTSSNIAYKFYRCQTFEHVEPGLVMVSISSTRIEHNYKIQYAVGFINSAKIIIHILFLYSRTHCFCELLSLSRYEAS